MFLILAGSSKRFLNRVILAQSKAKGRNLALKIKRGSGFYPL